MPKGKIIRALLGMKHSPAGKKYLAAEKKKKLMEKITSYNYYGGANKRRKTADELLKEIKAGK